MPSRLIAVSRGRSELGSAGYTSCFCCDIYAWCVRVAMCTFPLWLKTVAGFTLDCGVLSFVLVNIREQEERVLLVQLLTEPICSSSAASLTPCVHSTDTVWLDICRVMSKCLWQGKTQRGKRFWISGSLLLGKKKLCYKQRDLWGN